MTLNDANAVLRTHSQAAQLEGTQLGEALRIVTAYVDGVQGAAKNIVDAMKVPGTFDEAMAQCKAVAAQAEADRERYIASLKPDRLNVFNPLGAPRPRRA